MPFVFDEWFGVVLPKTVFIQNARLGCVDMFMKLCVVGYVIATLWTNNDIINTSYVPETALTVWAEHGGNYQKESRADMNSSMCKPAKNDRYDYWYDKKGEWSYTNQTCVELGPRDRAMKTATSVYVPTYVDEDFIWTKVGDKAVAGICSDAQCLNLGKCPVGGNKYTSELVNDDGQCLCKCSTKRKQFATGVDHIVIAFAHLPRWPESVIEKVKSRGVDPAPKNLKDINMVTVVRDHDKKEFKRFAPGEDIRVSVADALWLGGKYSLDDHNHDFTAPNYLLDQKNLPALYKDQLKLYPYLRVTGVSVNVKISYFNAGSDGHGGFDDQTVNPVCYIDVHVIPKWTSNPVRDTFKSNQAGEEEMRSRYYYGVLITFSASGSYEFFDQMKFLTALASFIVYLSVPGTIMVFLTKFGLGTLSEIYYEAQCTLLDTWELFSGQVCRAIVGMVVFHKISNTGRHSLQGGAGTSSVPSQTLALTSGAPEEESKVESTGTEVSRTSQEVRKADKVQHTLGLDMLKTELMELFESQECLDQTEILSLERVLVKILEEGQPITQFSFVQAVVNGDIGSLKGWANLFDQDRKPCCLERLFDTQRKARRHFHDEAAQSTSQAEIANANIVGLAESSESQPPEKVEDDVTETKTEESRV